LARKTSACFSVLASAARGGDGQLRDAVDLIAEDGGQRRALAPAHLHEGVQKRVGIGEEDRRLRHLLRGGTVVHRAQVQDVRRSGRGKGDPTQFGHRAHLHQRIERGAQSAPGPRPPRPGPPPGSAAG
jgi:hypothetical protein